MRLVHLRVVRRNGVAHRGRVVKHGPLRVHHTAGRRLFDFFFRIALALFLLVRILRRVAAVALAKHFKAPQVLAALDLVGHREPLLRLVI